MDTLISFFEQSCDRFPGNVFLRENTGGSYTGITYNQARERVHQFAAGLISLGIRQGDRIALISEGRNAWVISELGILYAGAVNVPLSVNLTEPDELKFRLVHSGARMVIVSGNQASKINNIKPELTALELTILLDDPGNPNDGEISFDRVLDAGREFLENSAAIFEARWKTVNEDDLANICYTSGTTADPKGVMLTHGNYLCNVHQAYSLMDIQENYSTLLLLPWDHAFAHTAGIYCFMAKGASIASVKWGRSPLESLRNLPGNILEVKPHLLMSVPALADKFRKNIEKNIRSKGRFASGLFSIALRISYWHNKEGWNRGKGLSFIAKPILKIFERMFFRRIREGFGGRIEFFVGGGALLDIEYQRFFYALGIPMFQGYGLTEASPVISSNTWKRHKLGSSGIIAAGLELKICSDKGEALPVGSQGEIAVKGGNVMKGYWKNEEATRSVIRDGWLYTGDLGYMDRDGFLYVLGRFKSLLIANDGEKYSPEGMEESFCSESEFIDQCMLYNNQDPLTVILIVPSREKLLGLLARNGISHLTDEGAVMALQKIGDELKEYRPGGKFYGRFPQRWLPAAAGILEEPFTEENHLLNSTLKMVRGRIAERYHDRITGLYAAGARDMINPANLQSMKVFLH